MQKPKSGTKSPNPPASPSPKTDAPKSSRTSAAKAKAKKITTLKALDEQVPKAVVSSNGTNVTATVVVDGTNALGRAVFVEPTSAAAVLNNLVCRAQLDPQAEPLEPISPTITGLQQTVRAMSLGQDIEPYKAHIQQIASNQPEKGDVVRAYVNQANHEVLADMIEMRSNAVRHVKRATRLNEVSVGEALVVWRMCNEQIPQLTQSIGENDKAVDTVTVVEKIDYKRQQTEVSVAKRWEGTTPQGRELIRKKLWELKRKILAEQGVLPPGLSTTPKEPAQEPTATPS